MHRTPLAALTAAVIAVVVLPGGAAGARTNADRTPSYDVTATLDAHGRLAVTETIVFVFGSTTRHGITREIPTRPAAQGGVFVENVQVHSPDGASALRGVQRTDRATTIRIGDPSRTVAGRHTYVLRYTLGGATAPDGENVHVAWNAIGTSWRAPIGRATVRLTAPAKPSGVICYVGPQGSRRHCAGERTAGRTLDVTESGLAAGNGITVEASFPGAKVAADPLETDRARVTALEPSPSAAPVADGSSSGEKLTWGLVLGGVLLAAVALGLATRGGGRGGGGGSSGGRYYTGAGYGGDSGGGAGSGAGGGGGGSW